MFQNLALEWERLTEFVGSWDHRNHGAHEPLRGLYEVIKYPKVIEVSGGVTVAT